jgi:dihydroorotase
MRVNPSTDLVLTVNGTVVKQFKAFPYLGSLNIIDDGDLENVHTNIKEINVAFVKLYPVWRNKYI